MLKKSKQKIASRRAFLLRLAERIKTNAARNRAKKFDKLTSGYSQNNNITINF